MGGAGSGVSVPALRRCAPGSAPPPAVVIALGAFAYRLSGHSGGPEFGRHTRNFLIR